VKGRIYALQADTGKVVWETYTVPTDASQPGNKKMQERALATWSNPNGVPITGGGTWTSYSLDAARGLLYVPVGNPGPDFTNRVRVGDNLYTNSVLVLDAKTGVYKSHYSLVPADFHDWDVAAAPVLVTTKGGKRVVAAAPKDGMLYVHDLDRGTRLYATAVTTRENVDTPLSTTPTRFCPGVGGGSEWNGPAYSPETNLFYDGTADWCVTVTLDATELDKKPRQSWTGAQRGSPFGKRDANWSGWLVATDADTGKVKWRFHAMAPVLSGITPTAGGVITYLVEGRQRVAFAAGTRGGLFTTTPASAKIVVFGL